MMMMSRILMVGLLMAEAGEGDGGGGGTATGGGGDGEDKPKPKASEDDGEDKIATENAELRKRLAAAEREREKLAKAEADAKEAKLRSDGKLEEILKDRDAKITALEAEKADLKGKLEARDAADRQRSVLDKVLDGVDGAEARTLIRGAYLAAAQDEGWDLAPERVELEAKKRRKVLEEKHPDLFSGKARRVGGGSPKPNGAPGQGDRRNPMANLQAVFRGPRV